MAAVPYCPMLPALFFGEELYQLARMWTRGWDVFAPGCALCFHLYTRAGRAGTARAVRSSWGAPNFRCCLLLSLHDTWQEAVSARTHEVQGGDDFGQGCALCFHLYTRASRAVTACAVRPY